MTAAAASYDDAYKQTLRETDDPRAMERRVFAQITAELEAADRVDPGPNRTKALNEALHRNQSLWNRVLFDVADPRNALPEGLRAQLISFALFVDRHTRAVLNAAKPISPLIDLNRRIMLGLAGVRASDPSFDPTQGGAHGPAH